MVRGRRQNSLGISLFAFQDIIMSVTGVLILIVLLLVLELLTQNIPDPAEDQLREIAGQLQAEIATLTAEAVALERDVHSDDETMQQAIENPESVLSDRLKEERERQERAEGRLKSLESVEQQLTEEAEKQADQQEVLTDRQRQIAELQRQKAALEKRLEQLTNQEATRYMTPHGINPLQAWLCEVNQNGLSMRLLEGGRALQIPVRSWDDEGESAFAQLKLKLNEISPRVRYILFVIRPSGRMINDPLVIKGEELNLEFGVEYVAEDHVILQ